MIVGVSLAFCALATLGSLLCRCARVFRMRMQALRNKPNPNPRHCAHTPLVLTSPPRPRTDPYPPQVGTLRAFDADSYYSPDAEPSRAGLGPQGGRGGADPVRRERRVSRLSVSTQGHAAGSKMSPLARGREGGEGKDVDPGGDLVEINFGGAPASAFAAFPPPEPAAAHARSVDPTPAAANSAAAAAVDVPPPAWWDASGPGGSVPEKVPEVPTPAPEPSPPSRAAATSCGGDSDGAFDGFRLKLDRMPRSLNNPPPVPHNLQVDLTLTLTPTLTRTLP